MDKLSIKAIRLINGLTQKQMAEKLGIAHSTYFQKEQGVIAWTLKDLIIVKKEFGINIDDLKEVQA